MNYFKALGAMVALAALASMALASSASADRFSTPGETPYTGSITASSTNFEGHGAAFSVGCKKVTFVGTVAEHGFGTDTGGPITTLDFAECSYPITVLNNGSFDVNAEGGGKGDFDLFNTSFTVDGPFGINCLYKADSALFGGTGVGSFTGSNTSNAVIDWTKLIPRTGDSAFCGSSGELTGSFTVTNPTKLTVE